MEQTFSEAGELEKLINKRFSVKNYLVKNKSHEKIMLSDDKGNCIVRCTIFKPADIEVYLRLMDVSSPNICNILEISEQSDRYIVYEEYCEGITLEDLGVCIGMKKALDIAIGICSGLYALHSCQIVHRDLKPENIIISDDNTVKILDYDAARVYKPLSDSDTRLLGTIGYAAPEQFGFQQSDSRSDLYSLCVILNMLITGAHPSVKMCQEKHIKKILDKCLAINPAERYNDVKELSHALCGARRRCKE